MNSKQYIPNVFHGKWRFPEKDEFRRQFLEYQECMGTLYYNEDKPIKLEVYHEPTQGVIARMDGYYDTIGEKMQTDMNLRFSMLAWTIRCKRIALLIFQRWNSMSIMLYWAAMFNQWMNRYSIFAR